MHGTMWKKRGMCRYKYWSSFARARSQVWNVRHHTIYSVSNFMNFTAQPGWAYIGLKVWKACWDIKLAMFVKHCPRYLVKNQILKSLGCDVFDNTDANREFSFRFRLKFTTRSNWYTVAIWRCCCKLLKFHQANINYAFEGRVKLLIYLFLDKMWRKSMSKRIIVHSTTGRLWLHLLGYKRRWNHIFNLTILRSAISF